VETILCLLQARPNTQYSKSSFPANCTEENMGKPTFLVVGGQKCGTTSLYKYLDEHPDVFMSPVKELRFFSGEAASQKAAPTGGQAISDFATYCEYFEGASKHQAAGEASPSYIFYPGTAERIHRHLPDVQIIAILRDPVDRAFSEYWHHWRMGRQLNDDFLSFVLSEDVDADPQFGDLRDCVRRGLYYRQLKPYFRLFDREQLLILFHEDLKTNAHGLMQRVYEFIGVDDSFVPKIGRAHNKGKMPSIDWKYALAQAIEGWVNWWPMDRSTRMRYRRRIRRKLQWQRRSPPDRAREELIPLFEDDVRKLESSLGRNLTGWTNKSGFQAV